MEEITHRALTAEECRSLLRHGGIGRIGVSIGALPAILPVCFAMLDLDIVFRATPGTDLSSTVANAVVAFQTDSLSDRSDEAWSVLAIGHAKMVEEPRLIASARQLDYGVWPSEDDGVFARLGCEVLSGRRYLRR